MKYLKLIKLDKGYFIQFNCEDRAKYEKVEVEHIAIVELDDGSVQTRVYLSNKCYIVDKGNQVLNMVQSGKSVERLYF